MTVQTVSLVYKTFFQQKSGPNTLSICHTFILFQKIFMKYTDTADYQFEYAIQG
jgi:hypothetical protein